jgi:hypothetical protein
MHTDTSRPKSAALHAPEAPLSPARALLAHAITQLWHAENQLEKAMEPLSEIERIRATATAGEASALRAEIQRLHNAHAAELATWIAGAGDSKRPVLAPEAFEAERRLRQIGAEAEAAKAIVAIAEVGSTGAAERVKEAMVRRKTAVWAAAVEACEPMMGGIESIIEKLATNEARLRGLVAVLREAGDQDPVDGTAAFSAAEAIERGIVKMRSVPSREADTAPARALLGQLSRDPRASL